MIPSSVSSWIFHGRAENKRCLGGKNKWQIAHATLARMEGKTIISRQGSQNWVKTLKPKNYDFNRNEES